MRTTLQNGVLCNGQQLGSAVNSSIDQGEFVAMKMLSGRRALRYKHQFCDKMTGEYLKHFCDNIVVLTKMVNLHTLRLAGFWALI